MSLHYIIDGYNVLKQVEFLTDRKLRAGREGLLHFIERYRLQGSSKNEITVVFDGSPQVSGDFEHPSIKVIFTKNESADSRIKKMVEQSANARRIIVVSDDKEIIFYCRSVGAKIKSVKEFLEKASSFRQGQKKQADEDIDKPELDSAAASAITEQLKNIWLKDEEEEI